MQFSNTVRRSASFSEACRYTNDNSATTCEVSEQHSSHPHSSWCSYTCWKISKTRPLESCGLHIQPHRASELVYTTPSVPRDGHAPVAPYPAPCSAPYSSPYPSQPTSRYSAVQDAVYIRCTSCLSAVHQTAIVYSRRLFRVMVRRITKDFLVNECDRQFYADHYTCSPPPLFIPCVTLIEVNMKVLTAIVYRIIL